MLRTRDFLVSLSLVAKKGVKFDGKTLRNQLMPNIRFSEIRATPVKTLT